MINMILAVDKNNTIGWTDGRLAYRLSHDMNRFKQLTTGHTVVMGRKTFDSLKRLNGLPNRRNIVLSKQTAPWVMNEHVEFVSSLDSIVESNEIARRQAAEAWLDEVPTYWIVGGASIYDQAIDMKIVDRIYLTLIDGESDADVRLKHDLATWKQFVLRQFHEHGIIWTANIESSQMDNGFQTTYLTLRKRT